MTAHHAPPALPTPERIDAVANAVEIARRTGRAVLALDLDERMKQPGITRGAAWKGELSDTQRRGDAPTPTTKG